MGKSKDETCCFCIPLETGVKVIAALVFIATIGSVVDIFYYDNLKVYLPFAIICGLQFCFFIGALMNDSVMNRHILCASYLLLTLIAGRCMLWHVIYDGDAFDSKMCGEDTDLEDCKK